MFSLFLRNLLFTILQPGLVAGLIPFLLLWVSGKNYVPVSWTASQYFGIGFMVFGFCIMLICIMRFATEGKGTLSPADPTKKLVVKGLYKYSRNPMYVGVITLLIGEAIFWGSWILAGYAVLVFVAFQLFILLHEEPRLRRDFGKEYAEYREKVRRWV